MEGQLVGIGKPYSEIAMAEDLVVVVVRNEEDELKEELHTGLLAQVMEGVQVSVVLVKEEVMVLMDAEHQIDLLNLVEQPIFVEDSLGDLDMIVHVPLYIYIIINQFNILLKITLTEAGAGAGG